MVYCDLKDCEMEEWSVRVMYSRSKEPPPVWMDLDQLEEIAEISGCEVSRKDGGVRFGGPGYRCLQLASESAKPFQRSHGLKFIISDGKYVELKVRCKGRRLAKVQIAKFIAVMQNKVALPKKWILYHGYLEDMKKYFR